MGKAFVDRHAITGRMSKIKHKIVVLSGKGGVGKSTVAVNLATSLTLAGKKVGLLDIDIHGPSIPRLTGLEGHPLDGTENVIFPVRKGNNLFVMSIGFMTPDKDEAVIWRGPLKFSIIRQFLRDVEWGDLDYLVIDSPPGTGDEPLTIAQLLSGLDGAVIVTTPQDVAIDDVRRSIVFCRKVGMAIIGVVENMSGFVCPHCGETTNVFKIGGGEKMAEEMGVPFLGRVPIDPRIVESSDLGISFYEHYSKSATAAAFEKVVRSILALPDKTLATIPSDLGNPEN
ncbi:MAG: ATP-binding protein [candidate division Zixibacteria bacterium CG_4_9_14_3_um_filter_46_8]|nr:MAG: ATP-binding protein [candidate division Zixibacteria bacterium CG_4_9_14_3_um_filter_46_8]